MNPPVAVKLLLEDGTEMYGRAFGAPGSVGGEVVFNTGMTGYVETLTDPSYRGQILVLTYPLVGNYGVPAPRRPGPWTAPTSRAASRCRDWRCRSYADKCSHHSATRSLGAWLETEGVPGDHRDRHPHADPAVSRAGYHAGLAGAEQSRWRTARNTAATVDMQGGFPPRRPRTMSSATRAARQGAAGGCWRQGQHGPLAPQARRDGDARALARRSRPARRRVDGIAHRQRTRRSQGPWPLVAQVRALPAYRSPSSASASATRSSRSPPGGDTYKLPYGHRGVNQPVQDLLTRRCYITSQNHGYAVRQEALPDDWEPWFVNVNDGTNEGIRARTRPFFSMQFHPEASPGPEDTAFLFDDFLRLVGAWRGHDRCTAPTSPKPRASSCSAQARCRSARRASSTTPAPRRLRHSRRGHRDSPRQPEHRHDPDQRRACRQALPRRGHAGLRRAHPGKEEVDAHPAVLRRPDRAQLRPRARRGGLLSGRRAGAGHADQGDSRHRGPRALHERLAEIGVVTARIRACARDEAREAATRSACR